MILKDAKLFEKEIDAIKRELDTLPEGRLTKKGAFYYVTIGSVQKGITRDHQRIMQLARKAYLTRRLRNIEWNFSLEMQQAGRYKSEDPAEIIRGLPSFFQTLPAHYFFHPSVLKQLENCSEGNAGHADGLAYLTSSGIRVRSKSERTIADALYQNRIPYRYEAAIALGGEERYPDFTIFRPSDGKMFLWEHLGLIDNDGYRQKASEKIALYIRHGFCPFDNLICTYEQDILNPAQIQTLIETHLLR